MNLSQDHNPIWCQEIEFSGGPCDGLRRRLPDLGDLPDGAELVSLFPDGRHCYIRTGRVTAEGLAVFLFVWDVG